jgi:pre-mRNA-splicing factor ISY1
MARNQEKAQAMLNRWVQMKKDAGKEPEKRRPFLASEVDNVNECQKWRNSIIRSITKKVSIIQNGSLGEHKIRDLNDHINKLLREKRHWERQIKLLGGPDYEREAPRVTDADGNRAMGTGGYFYFGAARELPGVRDLFDKSAAPAGDKVTRYDLYKSIDAGYYGYRDDDDGLLVKLEQAQEKIARAKAAEKWHQKDKESKKERLIALGMQPPTAEEEEKSTADSSASSSGSAEVMQAHVELPSQEQIEQLVLEKRRKELLAQYT